jgi:phosphatidylserine/phosphatidylglycerophosphate/cardiolipin synthase-like enzyme
LTARTGRRFLDWFHDTQAKRGAWAARDVARDSDTRRRFIAVWDGIGEMFGTPTITLAQFVALQSIFINELGGRLAPISEQFARGRPGHPGLAYLFDRIPGVKLSYNQRPNKTALECFNNGAFLAAHGQRALADGLAHTNDRAWAGTTYPPGVPTDAAGAAFVAEADFCKFRGRGLIQTTWRPAYKALVRFIQAYGGTNAKVLEYKARWAGQDAGTVCFQSSNADWHDLFQNSDYVIARAAVRLHNRGAHNYLAISPDPTIQRGTGPGSFHRMGLRIGGSRYATLFARRCTQILDTLAVSAAPSSSQPAPGTGPTTPVPPRPGSTGPAGLPAPGAATALTSGRAELFDTPLLSEHNGTQPDLILRWNDLPAAGPVDVVVHLHGFSAHGARMSLVRDKEPNSGLDLARRARPTVAILPRGHYAGGKSGAAYTFPALIRPGALTALITYSLERMGRRTGGTLSVARLILTAHSGGGAALTAILGHPDTDPDELHVFDALYGSSAPLTEWARRRLERDGALAQTTDAPASLLAGQGGALRILYIPGAGTDTHSLEVARALAPLIAAGGSAAPALAARYRAEPTRIPHSDIPRRVGGALLADVTADVGHWSRPPNGGPPGAASGGATLPAAAAASGEGSTSPGPSTGTPRMLDVCRPGDGPVAPEPDPDHRGPHPLLHRGTGQRHSRRPSVGYAQQCLNEFFAHHLNHTHACIDRSAEAARFIASTKATLAEHGQLPLAVDCRFGPNTQLATRAFQACHGLHRDGRIGPGTWRLLERFAPAPGPGPPPAPTPTPMALGALERRYFPTPGGHDAAPFSRAATVEPIVDGRDYFAAIERTIDALGPGDAWYIAGWWVDVNFTFARGGPTLGDLLIDRAAAGVDVRVIFWANRQAVDSPSLVPSSAQFFVNLSKGNISAAEILRARTVAGGRTPLAGRVLIDWSGNLLSSHHMKLSVFSHSHRLTAFAGGIDYQNDRLATPGHLGPSPLGGANAWHDAGVRMTGHGAERILQTFVTRWTEASTLSPVTYTIGAGAKQYNPAPLRPLTPPPLGPIVAASANTSVQVVRSFPDKKEFGLIRDKQWATLPLDGVHEIRRTLQTAIAAAKSYIYVEDQYFDAVAFLFPSLVEACRRGVRVIALIPGSADPTSGEPAPARTLSPAVSRFLVDKLATAQKTNLAVWQLAGIFVHTKVVLIDDEFMSVGSANFADRSMGFAIDKDKPGDDSELTVAAVSSGALVASLRVKLWSEHLRVSDRGVLPEISDLRRSLGFWRKSWGTGLSFPTDEKRNALRFVGPSESGPVTPPPAPVPPGSKAPASTLTAVPSS